MEMSKNSRFKSSAQNTRLTEDKTDKIILVCIYKLNHDLYKLGILD